ncbi:helix-turn-helix domain-containing protein [Nocardia cyriacigeorgica]|uniref:helix-turn-helix domain-containing protein n=1 Tax=Nocardia cyriacigeorgica TaxID=135487 RepID=UPI002804366A|nr:helix-turn-helix transcriptional regulator [Nocardia cyriacigeorgica]
MSGTDDEAFRAKVGERIRAARVRRGMDRKELAAAVDVELRQIGRWETGEQAPSLARSVQLAHALQVPIAEIAGETPGGIDLSGDWWAAWQTQKDGVERMDVHALAVGQQGEILSLDGSLARPVEEGSFQWLGELRLWDNEALMGWYRASDGAVRSKGTIYFALHPHGRLAWGSWVGQSYDGLVIRGWGAMAREHDEVERVVDRLIETNGSWSP